MGVRAPATITASFMCCSFAWRGWSASCHQAAGAFADVNVIDLAGLRLLSPELVTDFPLGASRFTQRAEGYDYTLVNGTVLVDHGELTGERAGRLVTTA